MAKVHPVSPIALARCVSCSTPVVPFSDTQPQKYAPTLTRGLVRAFEHGLTLLKTNSCPASLVFNPRTDRQFRSRGSQLRFVFVCAINLVECIAAVGSASPDRILTHECL